MDVNKDVGEGCSCSIVMLTLIIPFVLFAGEPDLMDALIDWIMK